MDQNQSHYFIIRGNQYIKNSRNILCSSYADGGVQRILTRGLRSASLRGSFQERKKSLSHPYVNGRRKEYCETAPLRLPRSGVRTEEKDQNIYTTARMKFHEKTEWP